VTVSPKSGVTFYAISKPHTLSFSVRSEHTTQYFAQALLQPGRHVINTVPGAIRKNSGKIISIIPVHQVFLILMGGFPLSPNPTKKQRNE
jgi:hypothetical protein